MKLSDFIKKLQQFDPDLPVCLGDWSDQYAYANESEAEIMLVIDDNYTYRRDNRSGKFLHIGSGDNLYVGSYGEDPVHIKSTKCPVQLTPGEDYDKSND